MKLASQQVFILIQNHSHRTLKPALLCSCMAHNGSGICEADRLNRKVSFGESRMAEAAYSRVKRAC